MGINGHQNVFDKLTTSISGFLPSYHTVLRSLSESIIPATSHVIDREFGFGQGFCVGTITNFNEIPRLLNPSSEITSDTTISEKRLSSYQMDNSQAAHAPHALSPRTPIEIAKCPRSQSNKKQWGLAEWPAETTESPADKRRKQVREAVRRSREKKRRRINEESNG
jgi:hypothetical protein